MNARETIMDALCAQLAKAKFSAPINACDTWATLSRRLKLWSDVASADQPALFVTEHAENIAFASESLPGKTTLNVDLFVYISAGRDPDSIPARDLNLALDALIAALAPPPGSDRQTLGGLVTHCRIEGRIVKDPGDLDGQGLALVPVKILAP
ncbi:hypothetical protein CCR94_01090 [Rhodoblastus sphagnicola]|uniref:DUF3168 domain-containing protein n=1 Tax=Rhodoblastus sphagnicola TaxID=333368 RepID=A0A2S6NGC0_9HYPH|nr:hypothetical protein [Rhodoblastus sphagnicola]MBB4200692.1 hypothetical protein [Rhodoblastus sphagnicola]PPQ33634.1 hypothetical protein CCR94_01090 [Rhodoblastus sphagnicola]